MTATKISLDAKRPVLLTSTEDASYLGTTERHVRSLWQERRLSAVKIGRRVRFTTSDLDTFIDRHRHPSLR